MVADCECRSREQLQKNNNAARKPLVVVSRLARASPRNVRTLRLARGCCAPFESPASGRARPPLPEVHRLVADHLHRAVVVVSVRRLVVADAVVALDGGVASLPSGLVVANRRTVMSGQHATRRRPHRPRGLNRRGAPNLRAGVEGAEPLARFPLYAQGVGWL